MKYRKEWAENRESIQAMTDGEFAWAIYNLGRNAGKQAHCHETALQYIEWREGAFTSGWKAAKRDTIDRGG